MPAPVFILSPGDDGVYLFGSTQVAVFACSLENIQQSAQHIGDGPQAEAEGRVFGPPVLQKERAGFVQDFQGPAVAGQIVVVDPVVDEGVGSAGLIAEMIDAVAVAAADHVGPERMPVARVHVHRMSGHGLGQREVPRIRCALVLDPDRVAWVPLAVAPAPSPLRLPIVFGFVPRGPDVAVVQVTVPASEPDVARQPVRETRQHAIRAPDHLRRDLRRPVGFRSTRPLQT